MPSTAKPSSKSKRQSVVQEDHPNRDLGASWMSSSQHFGPPHNLQINSGNNRKQNRASVDSAAATALYGPQKRVTVHNDHRMKKDQKTSARDLDLSRSNSCNKSKSNEGNRFKQFTNLPGGGHGAKATNMNPFAPDIDKLLDSKSSSQSHSNAKDPIY